MVDYRETFLDYRLAVNHAWKLQLSWELTLFDNIEWGGIFAFFNEYFMKRNVQVKEYVPDVLGHSSEVMIDESESILGILIVHLLWND